MTTTIDRRWSDPGATEVAEGVHRIALPIPDAGLHAVNVYVVEREDGILLIDSGWALTESRALLGQALASIGHRVSDIRQILVTHVHADHYSQSAVLRKESGASVALGVGDRLSLEVAISGEHPGERLYPALRAAGAGVVVAELIEAGYGTGLPPGAWELPDIWLRGGERISVSPVRTLDAIPTPGHTRGHHVFADWAGGLMFTGDHILPTITPSIGYESAPSASPLADYLASLAMIEAAPDAVMLPAHGSPAPSTRARARELIDHHEGRLGECRAAVENCGATGYEVASRLRWTRRGRALPDLNATNRMLAVTETVAHLDVLVARGELGFSVRAGRRVFRPRT